MKRGSIQDLFYVASGVFFLTLLVFTAYYVINQTNTSLTNALTALGAPADLSTILSNSTGLFSGFITGLPLGFILGGVLILLLAHFIPVPPIFMPVGVIMLLLGMVLFVYLDATMSTILSSGFFLSLSVQFPVLSALSTHSALLFAVFGVALIVVMYGRSKSTSYGGTPEG